MSPCQQVLKFKAAAGRVGSQAFINACKESVLQVEDRSMLECLGTCVP